MDWSRVLKWTFGTGAICFALGFFGPIVLKPDANQGPLLGIFITGPLGTVAGFLIGVVRELMHRRATPRDLLARIPWKQVRRTGAIASGVLLLLRGAVAVAAGVDRPLPAGMVIGVLLLGYGAMSRSPAGR